MARDQDGLSGARLRPDAHEALGASEAGQIAAMLLHVLAEAAPERARLVIPELAVVNEHGEA